MSKKMKVVVTGAAGGIGKLTVKALHAAGHEVTATDQCFSRDLPVRVEVTNLLDADQCYKLCEGQDVLCHFGNVPGIWAAKPQHTYGEASVINANVFQAAVDMGIKKIVYASSIQAIGGRREEREVNSAPPSQLPYLPLDGHVPPNPGNLYALAKAAAEKMLQYYSRFFGISAVAIRFPSVLSPQNVARVLFLVKDEGTLDEGFSYLAQTDAAELILAVVQADLPGFRIYQPAGPGTKLSPMPVEEIIKKYYPNVPVRAKSEYDNLVDISEITRDTGWTPKTRMVP